MVPVLRDHPVVPKKAVSQDRWSLMRGSSKIGIIIILKLYSSVIFISEYMLLTLLYTFFSAL